MLLRGLARLGGRLLLPRLLVRGVRGGTGRRGRSLLGIPLNLSDNGSQRTRRRVHGERSQSQRLVTTNSSGDKNARDLKTGQGTKRLGGVGNVPTGGGIQVDDGQDNIAMGLDAGPFVERLEDIRGRDARHHGQLRTSVSNIIPRIHCNAPLKRVTVMRSGVDRRIPDLAEGHGVFRHDRVTSGRVVELTVESRVATIIAPFVITDGTGCSTTGLEPYTKEKPWRQEQEETQTIT